MHCRNYGDRRMEVKPVKHKWVKVDKDTVGVYHGIHNDKHVVAVPVANWPFPKWVHMESVQFTRSPKEQEPEYEEALM